jgi:hypothetical protein
LNISLEIIGKFAGFFPKVILGFVSSSDYLYLLLGVKMISDVDCVRLAMPSGSEESQRDHALKRKAWLAVFLGSALFWVVVAMLVWKFWG